MSQADPASLEVCIDTAAGLGACQGLADRIELCSALSVGGLTPTPGLIAAARQSRVPVHAMIRPRTGGFEFDDHDIETCCGDIAQIRANGLAGVVLGASRDGRLNLSALRRMSDAAGALERTLHRVIDLTLDADRAVREAIDLGFSRILTSGGERAAMNGLDRLKQMQDVAAGRIVIMAGSGVTAHSVPRIAEATGIRAFHASCSGTLPQDPAAQALGFAGPSRKFTDVDQIRAMRAAVDALNH